MIILISQLKEDIVMENLNDDNSLESSEVNTVELPALSESANLIHPLIVTGYGWDPIQEIFRKKDIKIENTHDRDNNHLYTLHAFDEVYLFT